MKNKINNLLDKKSLKIIIPVIVLLVLLIIVFIYTREYQYNRYRDKQVHSFYQYFAGQKVEYDATVSFNKEKVIKGFVPEEIKINYETIPIYYKDVNKVIFPSVMSVVFPLKKDFQWKIPEFSYIEKVNNLTYLTFEDYNTNIDHYVIYDGKNLYLFSDSVTFTINNEEVTLSPLSYVIAKPNEFSYYDYETDTYKIYDTDESITVYNDYYQLNVTRDYFDYFGNKALLTGDFEFLSFLEEK